VRLVVPYGAGSAIDIVFRVLGNRLSESWRQPVVIENRPGGGTNIGTRAAAQSAPDGHTLLGGGTPLATNRYIYPSLGYDPVRDLAPVTLVGSVSNVMVVPNSSPANSVRDFISYANANRGKVTFGAGGVGQTPHLSGELLKRMAHIEMVHVPYISAASAGFNDLIAGRVDALFTNLPTILSAIQTGAVRALAVTSASRSSFAPDIPTFAESGLPGYDVTAWYALFAPAKTPVEIVTRIHDDAVAALENPAVTQRFEQLGVEIVTSTPAGLVAYLKSEMEKWGPIIKEAGIKAE
jgi:tripartite-type tricarboxylate transporter receptor subunit TctC